MRTSAPLPTGATMYAMAAHKRLFIVSAIQTAAARSWTLALRGN